MIIQAGTDDFPRYWDRVLFVAGLAIYTAGQVLINLGRDFVEAQTPIDFAHWLLLLGVLFLIPFTGRLPRRNLHLLTLPLLIAGIAAVIGMCLIDFIFWSLPAGDLENRLASELIATPSIWPVFITIGPNHVFSLALMLPSLSYYRASRAGTALVIIGTLIVMLGVQWFNVIGYAVLTLGYGLNFNGLRPPGRADP